MGTGKDLSHQDSCAQELTSKIGDKIDVTDLGRNDKVFFCGGSKCLHSMYIEYSQLYTRMTTTVLKSDFANKWAFNILGLRQPSESTEAHPITDQSPCPPIELSQSKIVQYCVVCIHSSKDLAAVPPKYVNFIGAIVTNFIKPSDDGRIKHLGVSDTWYQTYHLSNNARCTDEQGNIVWCVSCKNHFRIDYRRQEISSLQNE